MLGIRSLPPPDHLAPFRTVTSLVLMNASTECDFPMHHAAPFLAAFPALEALALQTRHIVDQMNAKGHAIQSIYMSGGQAKNAMLMQLFANTCSMPVVLPQSSGAAVVLGAAMLGRFAAELKPAESQTAEQSEARWKIMVSGLFFAYIWGTLG